MRSAVISQGRILTTGIARAIKPFGHDSQSTTYPEEGVIQLVFGQVGTLDRQNQKLTIAPAKHSAISGVQYCIGADAVNNEVGYK